MKFQAKKSVVHYVAELMKMTSEGDDKEWCVKFLRKQTPSSTLKFVYPQIEQIYDVKAKDFVLKLPLPDKGVRRHFCSHATCRSSGSLLIVHTKYINKSVFE